MGKGRVCNMQLHFGNRVQLSMTFTKESTKATGDPRYGVSEFTGLDYWTHECHFIRVVACSLDDVRGGVVHGNGSGRGHCVEVM